MGLIVFDETVLGAALPTITRELGLSQTRAHWTVNAYLLTFTCAVAIGGRLAERLGHRNVFLGGVALFGLASLAAGFADSDMGLIAARAAQGIGGAFAFPASFAMMTSAFPEEERGRAFGIQTTVGGMFMAAGPLAGGLFASEISWRWIFWVNLPVVVAIAAGVLAARPGAREPTPKRAAPTAHDVDLAGLATLVAGLVALVVALMESPGWGFGSPATLILLAGGLVALALFVRIEARRADPLIDLGLMRRGAFTGGVLVFFVFQWDKIIVFIFTPLYLQRVLDASPVEAGLAVMVAIVPTLATSLWSGKLADRFGSRRPLMAGLAVNGAAACALAAAAGADDAFALVAAIIVWGATLPFIAVPSRRALMGAAPAANRGQASGINLTVQMLGGVIGMALCSALYATTGSFVVVFAVTGLAVLAAVPLTMRTIAAATPARRPA